MTGLKCRGSPFSLSNCQQTFYVNFGEGQTIPKWLQLTTLWKACHIGWIRIGQFVRALFEGRQRQYGPVTVSSTSHGCIDYFQICHGIFFCLLFFLGELQKLLFKTITCSVKKKTNQTKTKQNKTITQPPVKSKWFVVLSYMLQNILGFDYVTFLIFHNSAFWLQKAFPLNHRPCSIMLTPHQARLTAFITEHTNYERLKNKLTVKRKMGDGGEF